MAVMQAADVITRTSDLMSYWRVRNEKFKRWYQMIEMVDELKTDKMESFVGNDPRSLYNLVLHLLDQPIPHRFVDTDRLTDLVKSKAAAETADAYDMFWRKQNKGFRSTGPFPSIQRHGIGLMLATGWACWFGMTSDDGNSLYANPLNPSEVYPMWGVDGLNEVARVFEMDNRALKTMLSANSWNPGGRITGKQTVRDYWWVDVSDVYPFQRMVWNAVVVGQTLVKPATPHPRFKRIPIFIQPVGGLPDTGGLSQGARPSTGGSGQVTSERWKEEIGQAIIATNENVYRTWNKWWTYGLQLLRDTAQPRIFERSQSGKAIVKPEEIWKRGAIFRGGINDSVEFLNTPPVPLELRQNQIDLEAMMQRGGVSWAMHGAIQGRMTTYMMSLIASSAMQVVAPFHQALINIISDIDNSWLDDMRDFDIAPYGFKLPKEIDDNMEITASYEIEIPGDIVQKATVSRMLDPDFRVPESYVLKKLWPDIKDPISFNADIRADVARRHPINAIVALIDYYRKQAQFMYDVARDQTNGRLFEAVADTLEAQIMGEKKQEPQPGGAGAPAGIPGSTPMLQAPTEAKSTPFG